VKKFTKTASGFSYPRIYKGVLNFSLQLSKARVSNRLCAGLFLSQHLNLFAGSTTAYVMLSLQLVPTNQFSSFSRFPEKWVCHGRCCSLRTNVLQACLHRRKTAGRSRSSQRVIACTHTHDADGGGGGGVRACVPTPFEVKRTTFHCVGVNVRVLSLKGNRNMTLVSRHV
jgi:hypothetical protein